MVVRKALRWLVQRIRPQLLVAPQGDAGISKLGHRDYVGGCWDEMGWLQLHFLQEQGLQPEHVLLDIACGSLRLGVKAIPYLNEGCYVGVEKEAGLLECALSEELDPAVREAKKPQFLVDASFDFRRIGRAVDCAMAQSLFSHLPEPLIMQCLLNLRPCLLKDGVFYATFFEVDAPVKNPRVAHDHYGFRYTRAQMIAFGEQAGFEARYIGEWGHPRGQVMVEYRPR